MFQNMISSRSSIKETKPFSLLDLQDTSARILLIEDDPVARWLVRQALKDACDLYTADCAITAMEKFIEVKPDLVFLDIELPDKDGRQVLDWIMNKFPRTNVIMLSCHDDPDIVGRTLEQGARGFITKPFLKETLLQYINSI